MHWDTTAKYEFLLKVTNAVVTQTNREDMFAALARELKKSFAYDRLSIYIFMPDTEELVYFASATGVIPVAGVGLILGVHRVLSSAFVPINVLGNSIATLVVARMERALDTAKLDRELLSVPDGDPAPGQ